MRASHIAPRDITHRAANLAAVLGVMAYVLTGATVVTAGVLLVWWLSFGQMLLLAGLVIAAALLWRFAEWLGPIVHADDADDEG